MLPLRSPADPAAESSPPSPSRLQLVRRAPQRGARRRNLSLAGVAAAAALLFLAPVPFPAAVHTSGRIVAAQRWVLLKGADGQLVTSTFDDATGLSAGYAVFNFNRGSSVQFSIRPALQPGQRVAAGDTLGSVFSSEMQERLVALHGQLATAREQLAVSSSGEKAAIIREAEQRLAAAGRRLQEHQKVVVRSRNLLERNLIAQGEFERVESEENSLRDDIAIARSNLEAARTGAKPEQLRMVAANVAALESEIASIQGRAASYTVTAPIAGVLARAYSADTLLTIADEDNLVALLPLRLTDSERLLASPPSRVRFRVQSHLVYGTIREVHREIRSLHGEKVRFATACLDAGCRVVPGTSAPCRIDLPPRTVRQEVGRRLAALPDPRAWWGL